MEVSTRVSNSTCKCANHFTFGTKYFYYWDPIFLCFRSFDPPWLSHSLAPILYDPHVMHCSPHVQMYSFLSVTSLVCHRIPWQRIPQYWYVCTVYIHVRGTRYEIKGTRYQVRVQYQYVCTVYEYSVRLRLVRCTMYAHILGKVRGTKRYEVRDSVQQVMYGVH